MRYIKVEKRVNDVVNRLNKTKEEKTIDFAAEKAARLAAEKRRRKDEIEMKKAQDEAERRRLKEETDMRSYGSVLKETNMTTNKREGLLDPKKLEEDFF